MQICLVSQAETVFHSDEPTNNKHQVVLET